MREHDTGTYGTEALKTRGDYEAGLQAQVVAAETALSAEIGGREAVVFLAPMGAHNAIGFEAWQAVASMGGGDGRRRRGAGHPRRHAAKATRSTRRRWPT